jgi:hypothetical protein
MQEQRNRHSSTNLAFKDAITFAFYTIPGSQSNFKMSPVTPAFEELPLDKNGPEGNAWGRFGERDQMGMLNLLTPETVKEAAKEIKEGVRVSLDWHLSKPAHPFFGRQVFFHHIHHKAPRVVNDDMIVFNTQCSTQWDGFRHYGGSVFSYTVRCTTRLIAREAFQDAKKFYSGFTQDDIANSEALGINGLGFTFLKSLETFITLTS